MSIFSRVVLNAFKKLDFMSSDRFAGNNDPTADRMFSTVLDLCEEELGIWTNDEAGSRTFAAVRKSHENR